LTIELYRVLFACRRQGDPKFAPGRVRCGACIRRTFFFVFGYQPSFVHSGSTHLLCIRVPPIFGTRDLLSCPIVLSDFIDEPLGSLTSSSSPQSSSLVPIAQNQSFTLAYNFVSLASIAGSMLSKLNYLGGSVFIEGERKSMRERKVETC